MKNKFFIAVLAVAAPFAFCQPTRAQVTSPTLFSITNFPVTLASNVVSITTNMIPLTKNCCVAFSGTVTNTLLGGTVVIQGSWTVDGTNYGVAPWTLTVAEAGQTKVTIATNWSQATLSGYSGLNITTITNTGAGTMTNFGFVISRPTLNTLTY